MLWKFDKVDLTNEVFVWKQVEMKFPHLENFIAAAREIPAAKDSVHIACVPQFTRKTGAVVCAYAVSLHLSAFFFPKEGSSKRVMGTCA